MLIEKLNTLSSYFENLKTEIQSLEEKKVKASAPRARSIALTLKKELHEFRKQIAEVVKELPTKKRVKQETKQETKREEKKEESKTPPAPKRKRTPKKKV